MKYKPDTDHIIKAIKYKSFNNLFLYSDIIHIIHLYYKIDKLKSM